MSRVGKQVIKVPAGVKADIKGDMVSVEGPKGKLKHKLPKGIAIKLDAGVMTLSRDDAFEGAAALHGLTRTVVHNMVHGVSQGFVKELDVVGVGYRAATKGNVLNLTLGYSHPIDYKLPEGIQEQIVTY